MGDKQVYKLTPAEAEQKEKDRVFYRKLNDEAIKPFKWTQGSAGIDLFSPIAVNITKKGGRAAIPIGISYIFPEGCYGRIAPRSGLATNAGIDVLAGVIDRDFYPNDMNVLLINHGEADYYVQRGDRIAQIIIEKISTATPELLNNPTTEQPNQHKGFGSTGR
jgi:dUTP pyrophosphatase